MMLVVPNSGVEDPEAKKRFDLVEAILKDANCPTIGHFFGKCGVQSREGAVVLRALMYGLCMGARAGPSDRDPFAGMTEQ